MPLELTYRSDAARQVDGLPVELEGFTPDRFRGESIDAVRGFEAMVGNRPTPLGDLFDIEGSTDDGEWRLAGDLAGVHYVGAGMREGSITVEGPVGRHAGAGMVGGALAVRGDAGDWLGAEMRGGRIDVGGNAGDYLGAGYPGSARGVRGGTVVVRGAAGDYAGHTMRRGWITVGDAIGQFAGYRMRAGTLMVFGETGTRPGAEMVRGTLGLFGPTPQLLPTFRRACAIEPQFLAVMARSLQGDGLTVPSRVELWHGDLLTGGRGEVLLPRCAE
ncbi:MAG: formylmethanofuran dehydrogenase subunit C [Planctomycetota bacterium]